MFATPLQKAWIHSANTQIVLFLAYSHHNSAANCRATYRFVATAENRTLCGPYSRCTFSGGIGRLLWLRGLGEMNVE
jgi:hypothetical protein